MTRTILAPLLWIVLLGAKIQWWRSLDPWATEYGLLLAIECTWMAQPLFKENSSIYLPSWRVEACTLKGNRYRKVTLCAKEKGGELGFCLLERGRGQGLNSSDGRPDTCLAAVAVTYCKKATVDPTIGDWRQVKRVTRYHNGTEDYSLNSAAKILWILMHYSMLIGLETSRIEHPWVAT